MKEGTPKEVVEKLNNLFTEWKTTKQVKYDKDGRRIEDDGLHKDKK